MANKLSVPAKVVRYAAKRLGYDLAPSGSLTPVNANQSSLTVLNRLMRFIGLTAYNWGDWDRAKFIDEGYLGNSGLYSIVNRITRTAALAPFKVFKIKDQKKFYLYKNWTGERATEASIQKALMIKQQVFEEDNEHPLNALIDKPNQWQRGNEYTQTCIGFKLLTGNRFIFQNKLLAGANAGKPVELYNLPPQHMMLVIGEGLWKVAGYQLQLGNVVSIPFDLVIHSRYWNPQYDAIGSHLWGLSPLRAASKTLERSNKAEERGVTMLTNAGAAGLLFDKSGVFKSMSTEQAEEMKGKLNDEILGVDNSGRIALANGDIGYINFALTAVEMQVIEQERYSDEKLANIFGVPPGLFMASANATDNNIKAWNRQLISQAVVPALADLRDDWNEVAQAWGTDIYIDYDLSVYPELQEDIDKVVSRLDKQWYYTGNEKRLMTGGDEDTTEPMMNKYLIPGLLKEISTINPDFIADELDRAIRDEESGRNISQPKE